MENRWFLLLLVIIFALLFGSKILKKIGDKDAMEWHFKGAVEKIRYDKHYPTIWINGKDYSLYYTIWNFDIKIQPGDTIIKKENDLRIYLIRRSRKDTIYFNSRN